MIPWVAQCLKKILVKPLSKQFEKAWDFGGKTQFFWISYSFIGFLQNVQTQHNTKVQTPSSWIYSSSPGISSNITADSVVELANHPCPVGSKISRRLFDPIVSSKIRVSTDCIHDFFFGIICTVWKFKNFPITKIINEFKLGLPKKINDFKIVEKS